MISHTCSFRSSSKKEMPDRDQGCRRFGKDHLAPESAHIPVRKSTSAWNGRLGRRLSTPRVRIAQKTLIVIQPLLDADRGSSLHMYDERSLFPAQAVQVVCFSTSVSANHGRRTTDPYQIWSNGSGVAMRYAPWLGGGQRTPLFLVAGAVVMKEHPTRSPRT